MLAPPFLLQTPDLHLPQPSHSRALVVSCLAPVTAWAGARRQARPHQHILNYLMPHLLPRQRTYHPTTTTTLTHTGRRPFRLSPPPLLQILDSGARQSLFSLLWLQPTACTICRHIFFCFSSRASGAAHQFGLFPLTIPFPSFFQRN